MKRHRDLFATAARYALLEHGRNHFALVLIAAFLPLWTALAYAAIPAPPVRVRLRATGEWLAPHGNELTSISGALNAVTLITGFLMFAATFTSGPFDRRLAMAGFPRFHLMAAKLTGLCAAAAVIAAYATAVICLVWDPHQPFHLALALFTAGMTYGVLGVGFGALLRREVEGMFAIVMTSIIDLLLQNPIMSAGADDAVTQFLPSYGAMQTSIAAGFSTTFAGTSLLIQLAWCTAAAALALLAFHHRTRSTLTRPAASPPGDTGTRHAAATPTV
ncbi:ABC transporter permease [Streptomyces sp. NPDC029526]|uniref:ABC transporter permease n=1 Tax=Streptomyces sp. NPDC029526 TaxID=3155728 RepID=UPI0033F54D64